MSVPAVTHNLTTVLVYKTDYTSTYDTYDPCKLPKNSRCPCCVTALMPATRAPASSTKQSTTRPSGLSLMTRPHRPSRGLSDRGNHAMSNRKTRCLSSGSARRGGTRMATQKAPSSARVRPSGKPGRLSMKTSVEPACGRGGEGVVMSKWSGNGDEQVVRQW